MTLERRTPLKRTELKRGTSQLKRTRLKPTGRKAAREADAIADFRAAVRARARGLCEGATPACHPGPHDGHHAHHVFPSDRDRGVHDPARGKLLCAHGHTWVHANPAEAEARGLLGRSGG